LLNRGFSSEFGDSFWLVLSFLSLSAHAFFISSADAIESITQIPIIANALHTAEVSAFSIAAVILISILPLSSARLA
jgi:hypothetical protein